MAGKPGIAADDDDLIIEIEEASGDFKLPESEEVVEDFRQPGLEAETVPDEDITESIDDDQALAAQQRDREGEEVVEDTGYDANFARQQQLEEQVRTEKANRIWGQAQAYADAAETKINGAKVALDTLNDRIENAVHGLAAAREAGDVRAELQIEDSIAKMRKLQGEIEDGIRQAPTKNQILEQGRREAQQALNSAPMGKKVGSGIQARHPLAERWASGNKWMRTNTDANNFVISQSDRLTREGWDPNSPSFYAELTRLVKGAYPNLKPTALQAPRSAGKAQMRGIAAPSRSSSSAGGGVRTSNGKTKFTLTQAEQATMRRHNLDPNNKSHQKAWAKTRMETSARERSLGR